MLHMIQLWIILILTTTTIMTQVPLRYDAIKTIKIVNEKEINTPNLESTPAFVGDKIAYVYTGAKNKFFDKLIDEPYFDIGFTTVELDNTLSNKKTFYKQINSDLHEGAMSYDANSNRLFFTRSHVEKEKIQKHDTTFLRIMSADLNRANPSVDEININVDKYSVCHPSLSTDGKTMIFSSNRPGSLGKMDLYAAFFDGQKWSGITNLSPTVNSKNNEIFPFLLNDTLLIYASDRQNGFGGLDMYASRLQNGEWSESILLPKPINSAFDDFGLIELAAYLAKGFLSELTARLPGVAPGHIARRSPLPT